MQAHLVHQRSRSNGKQSGETSFLPNQLLPERSLPMNPSYSTGLQGMNMQSTLQRRQMAARADPEDYPLFNLKGISFEDNCVWSAPFLTCSEGDDVRIRRLHRTTPADRRADGSVGEGFHDQSRRCSIIALTCSLYGVLTLQRGRIAIWTAK